MAPIDAMDRYNTRVREQVSIRCSIAERYNHGWRVGLFGSREFNPPLAPLFFFTVYRRQDMFCITVTKAFFNILINHYRSSLCIAFSIETSCRDILSTAHALLRVRTLEYFASQCQ